MAEDDPPDTVIDFENLLARAANDPGLNVARLRGLLAVARDTLTEGTQHWVAAVKKGAAQATIGGPVPYAAEAEALGVGRQYKGAVLARMAAELFRQIENELGIETARAIFGRHVTPRSKRDSEESNNVLLLASYIECRLPVQQFARQYAGAGAGTRARNAGAGAVMRQLTRLLERGPVGAESASMRALLVAARRVRQEVGAKRGRPRVRK
jgi:hypothetical protein